MTADDSFDARATREAVLTLGYLVPTAEASLTRLFQDALVEHPRSVCTRYRKTGEQIGRDEKRALGIRANAFLSRIAFIELTERGRRIPLRAHELTLLRAVFTRNRHRGVEQGLALAQALGGFVEFEHDIVNGTCPACLRLKALGRIPGTLVQIMPPVDCAVDACNLCVRLRVDWLARMLGPGND